MYKLNCPRSCFSQCMMITCLNPDANSSEMCESLAYIRETRFSPIWLITLIFKGQFRIAEPVLNKSPINQQEKTLLFRKKVHLLSVTFSAAQKLMTANTTMSPVPFPVSSKSSNNAGYTLTSYSDVFIIYPPRITTIININLA